MKLIELIEVLGVHSITVRELKKMFGLLKSDSMGFRVFMILHLNYNCNCNYNYNYNYSTMTTDKDILTLVLAVKFNSVVEKCTKYGIE